LLLAAALVACGGGGSSDCVAVYSSFEFGSRSYALEVGESATVIPTIRIQAGCTALQYELASGQLPPGMSLNAASGVVSGTPRQSGIYPFVIRPQAAGSVTAGTTLYVQPLGPQSPQLSPQRVVTTSPLPAFHAPQMTAVVNGATTLYVGGRRSDLTSAFQLWRSSDLGVTWIQITATGTPAPRGNLSVLHQFQLTEASGALYVLDSGGTTNIENPDRTVTSTPVSAALYRYDGGAWSVVNSGLPFQPPGGAAFFSSAGGLHVAWTVSSARTVWTSSDGGLAWSEDRSPTIVDNFGIRRDNRECAAVLNGSVLFVPTTGGGAPALSFLSPGDTRWGLMSTFEAGNSLAHWYTDPFVGAGAACTLHANRFWVAGNRAVPNYAVLLSAASTSVIEYPRRYKTTPLLVALASAGNVLVGLTESGETWLFR